MAIMLEWLDQDKTIVYAKLDGRTEHEDFIAAEVKFRAMLAGVPHLVDVIYDARGQLIFSPRMLETAQHLHRHPYSNLRFLVFVGRNLAWELFLIFVRQFHIVPYRFASAENLGEADEIIRRVRRESLIMPPAFFADWN